MRNDKSQPKPNQGEKQKDPDAWTQPPTPPSKDHEKPLPEGWTGER